MTFSQLALLHGTLRGNPNIGQLTNKNKIALMRFLTEAKNELIVYEETQKELFHKYKLEPGDTGDYSESNAELKKTDLAKWEKCEAEWKDLGKQESKVSPIILEEAEFFILCKEKKINRADGKPFDFCYSLDELSTLSKYLLAEPKKKAAK